MKHSHAIPLLCALAATAFLLVQLTQRLSAREQEGRRITIWDGVYSESQAAQGQMVFNQCRGCHGSNLDGGSAPPLHGDRFMEHWREDTLDSLYSFIKNTMPPRATGLLSESDALSVVSFILQSNDLPAGNADLTTSSLPMIHIEGRNGPQPLPNYAVVQVVGCTKGSGDNWTLVDSSDPVRAKNPGRATPEELKSAESRPLGTLTFQLQNLAMAGIDGSSLKENHRMFAKGPIIHQPNGERISITSLQEVADTCGPQ